MMGDYGNAMLRNPNAAVQGRTKAMNRVDVLQLKAIGQSHPTGLTNTLLKLFEPRQPLEYKQPLEKRKCPPYTGMAHFVNLFAQPGDLDYARPVEKGETPAQKRARIRQIRLEEGAKKVAEGLETYDPKNDPNVTEDPYKTLFVARLNYETPKSEIIKEFEAYGRIKQVRLVTDRDTNKPRGYAFVEYEKTRDMKAAYKRADGQKIDNRRVLMDVERGRTVPNWRPRRLAGGLGTTRVGGEEVNLRPTGREQSQPGRVSRSEEPKVRDERDREKKSLERGRNRKREREKSRERSHDRPSDRDRRDDRHHRDRDRTRDRDHEKGRTRNRDREKDRTRDRGKDRDRTRDRGRDRDHHRDRDGDRVRDHDVREDRDRGISRDRDRSYGGIKVEVSQGMPDRTEQGPPKLERAHGDYDYYENLGQGRYGDQDVDFYRYKESHRDNDRYDQMVEGGYGYDHVASEPKDRDSRHPDRSLSREYEY